MNDRIPVKTCYLPAHGDTLDIEPEALALVEQLRLSGTEIIEVSRGDVIDLPSGRLTVLWPEKGRVRPGKEANFYSMTLLAEIKGSTMLLTGDLDGLYEMYAAAPADILKAAHHGSGDSTGERFLTQVAPQTVLLSSSNLDRLRRMQEKAVDADVFSTRQHGALTICFDQDGYTITTFK